MSTENVRALIIEDDSSLGEAIQEALKREGINAYWTSRPEEGISLFSSNKVEFVIVDCLLPQMTGVDFVMKLRQMNPESKFKIILMSGIYTDKTFIQESVKKTQALSFLKKPFELEQILSLVKTDEKKEELPARKILYQIFSKEKVTNREKKKMLESIDEVSGFDLPFIYSLLAETKSSGYLNIYSHDGSVSGLAFANGSIVGVDVEDRQTYLGELLIQSGYVTPEDIQKALKNKTNKRLGQALIQSNLMSPHALDLMMTEQMNIRLSKTIVDRQVKLNFATSDVELISPSIDSDLLLNYLHDWIASKISVSWLKSLYMMWAGHVIIPTVSFRYDHPALRMSLVESLDGLAGKIKDSTTLSQLLEIKDYNQAALYKALHFLLTKGLIVFSTKAGFSNEVEQLNYLQKISAEIQGKNAFEILEYVGIGSLGAGNAEQLLVDFLPNLGTEPTNKESELYKLWTGLHAQFRQAAVSSRDGTSRNKFKKETEKNDAEAKIRATKLVEEARHELQLNQYQKAMDKITIAQKLSPQFFQSNIYMAWAKLGQMETRKNFNRLKDIEIDLMQVPPDERYDALYPFVMGLYYRAKGDIINAKKSFDKALALDSSFIVARRELGKLEAQLKAKKQDIFNMDLGQVVAGFFKKR